ncbi:MAG: hypothetical protein EB158_07255 [Nitrosopumilaceae archaeon]|nr:hypothetical protein [Nitrosopumilaceae archaeon]
MITEAFSKIYYPSFSYGDIHNDHEIWNNDMYDIYATPEYGIEMIDERDRTGYATDFIRLNGVLRNDHISEKNICDTDGYYICIVIMTVYFVAVFFILYLHRMTLYMV